MAASKCLQTQEQFQMACPNDTYLISIDAHGQEYGANLLYVQ